ncbi:FtsW/RodA/SpoVE family cell cycle protein [Fusobacterium necrophorum]|uniref:Rod shape-determining protein RodA n=1 Tax=Fusobacterium necrophorum subsp. funduliforme TaxID=143387 RepID=A0A170MWF7_9FUSO|nr:FtsW/RodA/SpoVE family cell cycle protein [Fusobacterium necrophorum]AVQ20622.1 FtsW/RodA/SpoVE family cell cycle protein [Fusobacterium necrophorum subsp. funduliforme]AYV92356.1 FtsW/RodA/SpoVE family cell cycle protein [Fusobacterium necrophorum subsp. funduliforme]EIJ72009.1 cell cycle protein, FtsW/RodA/SpoVE family [Fusobacterium necrophorum subsp. funduliforme ATCC 51357]EYD69537.1 cell cycle protein [Fusobacterium necrophorum subsp. funduliforme B35]KAB0553480.1 FtsW/RodA/SpoVE fami
MKKETAVRDSIYDKYQKLQESGEEFEKQASRNKRSSALLMIVFILLSLSIANMFSVSLGLRNDQLGLVKKHSLMIFIGLFLCFLLSKFSYKNFQRPLMRKLLYFVPPVIFIGMMIAPSALVPIRNGAKAWIQLGGFAIQPAELFKVSYIILLSNVLAKLEQEKHIKDYKLILSIGIFVFLPYVIFIHLQNDLGAIIHYALITGYLFVLSNISIKIIRLWSLLGSVAMISAFSIIYKIGAEHLSGYKLKRIYSFLEGLFTGNYSPEFGYQVKQALIGFGSGGFLGKGFANGIQKYSYVPETATDFISVTFGEEFGFLGMFILLSFYLILYWIICTISKECQDSFGKYLSAGIGGYLIIQVFINIGVAIGILPVFGLTLPLFSNGGSSIFAILSALGICLNINKTSHLFEKKKKK